MIKKFNNYIKEQLDRLDIDPYGEEDWNEKEEIYVIYVIGQDMNFLSKKIKRIYDTRRGWYYYEYIIATKTENGIHFNGSAIEINPYPAENIEKIYTGEELVGCIQNFGQVRFDTLKNLCDILGISMDNVIMYKY